MIILIAAYFRLAYVDLAEFKGDEARDAFVAKNFVENGIVPLVGAPTSVGGNAGPFYYFILSVPFFISANPIVASAFIAILNVVAITLTFKFSKEFFNERIALIASALVVASPFALIYSRKIWNPDLLFPFSVVLLYSLYSFAIKKKSKYLVPIGISFAILLQLHPVTLFLSPIILFVLVKFRKTVHAKHLLLGLVAAFLLFSPFFYFELQNGFKNTETLASTFSLFKFDKINMIGIQHIASLTSGSGFDYILGDSAKTFYSSIFNLQQFFSVENILLFFAFLYLLYKSKKTFSEGLKYFILLMWIVVPILILFFFTGPQYPHHLIMLYPVQFLAIAILFDSVFAKTGKINHGREIKALTFLLLIFILSAQMIFSQSFLSFLNNNGGTNGFYEIGVKYKLDVAKYASNTSENFSLSYSEKPNDIGLEYRYMLSLFNKTLSDNPAVQYIVVNQLSGSNESQALSKYQHINFGPLAVYSVR